MFITATCCTSINIAAQAKTPASWEKHKTKHQMSQASPSPKAHILSPKKAWLAERDWQWIWEGRGAPGQVQGLARTGSGSPRETTAAPHAEINSANPATHLRKL